MIQSGDQLPDFDALTLDGHRVNYRQDVWQKKLAVLVTFASPHSDVAHAYRSALAARVRELTACDTMLLIVPGDGDRHGARSPLPAPAVIIADRWGEVRDVEHPPDDGGLPGVDAIIEWLRFVQVECPECQGETK